EGDPCPEIRADLIDELRLARLQSEAPRPVFGLTGVGTGEDRRQHGLSSGEDVGDGDLHGSVLAEDLDNACGRQAVVDDAPSDAIEGSDPIAGGRQLFADRGEETELPLDLKVVPVRVALAERHTHPDLAPATR